MGWLNDIWSWIVAQTNALFQFFRDLIVYAVDTILQGIESVVDAIPMPSFLSGHTLNDYLGAVDPSVLYFLSQSGFSSAIAILGAGFSFRMLRKLFTLFQW